MKRRAGGSVGCVPEDRVKERKYQTAYGQAIQGPSDEAEEVSGLIQVGKRWKEGEVGIHSIHRLDEEEQDKHG